MSYEQFLNHPRRLAIIIACTQHWDSFHKLWEARGKRDELVFLSAQVEMKQFVPADYFNYLITHDLIYHRLSKAKYKILYFNRPHLAWNSEKDIRKSFENKQIQLYQNNFYGERKKPEVDMANEFRRIWLEKTGYSVPFFGANSEHGTILQPEIHRRMSESMFTLSFKSIETWGQMVNESMLLGTPVILAEEFITGTFAEYEITDDTAIIKRKDETVAELIERILALSFEEYETLCIQAKTIAELFTAQEPRQRQLKWLLSKIHE
jgi:glycosyltransferase involved in cell wall biosynthesis